MAKNIKEFGNKVAGATTAAAFPGMVVGQALSNYGAIGATIHQRGIAKSRNSHAADGFHGARK